MEYLYYLNPLSCLMATVMPVIRQVAFTTRPYPPRAMMLCSLKCLNSATRQDSERHNSERFEFGVAGAFDSLEVCLNAYMIEVW